MAVLRLVRGNNANLARKYRNRKVVQSIKEDEIFDRALKRVNSQLGVDVEAIMNGDEKERRRWQLRQMQILLEN